MLCSNCGYLNKGEGKCSICDHIMSVLVEKKPYSIPKRSKKGTENKAKDIEYYKQCFEYSPKICEECDLRLPEEWKPEYVAHIISRGSNTALRYDYRNHLILCFDCHFIFDHGDRSKMKVYQSSEIIRQELNLEYYKKQQPK